MVSKHYTMNRQQLWFHIFLTSIPQKLEPSDQIHAPGTSAPITELLDRGWVDQRLNCTQRHKDSLYVHPINRHRMIFCALFSLQFIQPNKKHYYKLGRMSEVVVTSHKVLSQHLPGGTMWNFVRACSPLDVMQTRDHLIIKQECYLLQFCESVTWAYTCMVWERISGYSSFKTQILWHLLTGVGIV